MKVRRNHLRAEEEELDLVGSTYNLAALRRQRRSRTSAAQPKSRWVGETGQTFAGPPDGQDAA